MKAIRHTDVTGIELCNWIDDMQATPRLGSGVALI
jgi:hypothetical protein